MIVKLILLYYCFLGCNKRPDHCQRDNHLALHRVVGPRIAGLEHQTDDIHGGMHYPGAGCGNWR